ncbi:MAG: hypothetical protein JF610_11325 [Acidobacteria bacterium]|nr:hypothetical protein [Acidobacteriota bacterium]
MNAGRAQRVGLIVRHAAHAADDVIFGREIAAERGPLTSRFPDREFTDRRLSTLDRVSRAEIGAVLAGPRHEQRILISGRGQA